MPVLPNASASFLGANVLRKSSIGGTLRNNDRIAVDGLITVRLPFMIETRHFQTAKHRIFVLENKIKYNYDVNK